MTGAEVGASDKVWRMFAATGDIAFACTYAQVLMDIQVHTFTFYILHTLKFN